MKKIIKKKLKDFYLWVREGFFYLLSDFIYEKMHDERYKKFSLKIRSVYHFVQRMDRGFDDFELWDLKIQLAKHIAPRLKAFANHNIGHPCGMEPDEWDDILDTMTEAFFLLAEDKMIYTEEENDKIDEGLQNFIDYYGSLWI